MNTVSKFLLDHGTPILALCGIVCLAAAFLWHCTHQLPGRWVEDAPRFYQTFKVGDEWFVRVGLSPRGPWTGHDLGPYSTEREANTYRDINAHAINRTWVGPGKPPPPVLSAEDQNRLTKDATHIWRP